MNKIAAIIISIFLFGVVLIAGNGIVNYFYPDPPPIAKLKPKPKQSTIDFVAEATAKRQQDWVDYYRRQDSLVETRYWIGDDHTTLVWQQRKRGCVDSAEIAKLRHDLELSQDMYYGAMDLANIRKDVIEIQDDEILTLRRMLYIDKKPKNKKKNLIKIPKFKAEEYDYPY